MTTSELGGGTLVPDITSAAFKAEPLPACAHLRSEQPVTRVPLNNVHIPGGAREAYLVTRYDDAASVLRDSRFVKDAWKARQPHGTRPPWMPRSLRPLYRDMLFRKDGDDHRRLRGLVRDTFTSRYIAELEPRIQAHADELLDRMEAAGRADLMADYALPLPLTIIAEIMGVPASDRPRFHHWASRVLTAATASKASVRLVLKLPSAIAMMRFLRRLVAERRLRPGDDVISRLATMEDGGDRLSEDELLAMVVLLVIAGYETTANLIATGTLLLLAHRDQFDRLRGDPELIGTAVEELLRMAAPLDMASERYALEDVEIGGVTIPRGALVMACLVSANADPDRFRDPERLDVARSDNRHLSFGQGPHYCLGAPLARLEGRIAIGSLMRRFPELRLATPQRELRWRVAFNFRGLETLPVELGASGDGS